MAAWITIGLMQACGGKGRRACRAAVLTVCLALPGCLLWAGGSLAAPSNEPAKQVAPSHTPDQSADLIPLDAIPVSGEREMPVPIFPHGRHVAALAEQGKSCGACHLRLPADAARPEVEQRYSFYFLGAEHLAIAEGNKEPSQSEAAHGGAPKAAEEHGPLPGKADLGALQDHFHSNCIPCHQENKDAGHKAGPVAEDCRSCHNDEAQRPVRFASGYDKALHYKHISSSHIAPVAPFEAAAADARNCGACHASFVPATGAFVWRPGTEESCRACHLTRSELADVNAKASEKAVTEDPRKQFLMRQLPLEEVTHTLCVSCHLTKRAQAASDGRPEEGSAAASGQGAGPAKIHIAGPVDCAGCHNAAHARAMRVRIAQVDAAVPKGAAEDLPGWAWRPSLKREESLQGEKRPADSGAGQSLGAFTQAQPVAGSGTLVREAPDAGGIPRLMRGQADAVLMLAASLPMEIADSGTGSGFMQPVSFNHAFHESRVNTCRACHHEGIVGCTSCHVIGGRPDVNSSGRSASGGQTPPFKDLGGGRGMPSPVPLNIAMHAPDSARSCVGCHNKAKERSDCAGCHIFLPAKASQRSCVSCHVLPPGFAESTPPQSLDEMNRKSAGAQDATAREKRDLLGLDRETRNRLAADAVAKREQSRLFPSREADIPEIVQVEILQNEYGPALMPHNAIIQTLLREQADSRLAGVFHANRDDLCQTCHHNGPASRTPPRCVSCHALAEDAPKGRAPSLKTAYHQLCIGCHTAMDQTPPATDCQGCHKPAAKPQERRSDAGSSPKALSGTAMKAAFAQSARAASFQGAGS